MSVSEPPSVDVRVSDADRERVVEQLRAHHADGRIALDEFTERVEEAYRARTVADLQHALRELPAERERGKAEHPSPRRRRRLGRLPMWWLRVNGVCTAIWAATTVGSGYHYFWPMWVMLGTGIPVLKSFHGHHAHHEPDLAAPVPPQSAPVGEDTDRIVTSVLFVDIVASTEHAVSMGDAEWNRLLLDYQRDVEDDVRSCRGRDVFTKGDEVVAGFATPAAAVRCGSLVRERARARGLEVRAGIHSGEVDQTGQQMRGLAIHIGQRVCAAAQPGQLLVSSTVRDLLVGSKLTFRDAGEHDLKGVPGPWRLYEVEA